MDSWADDVIHANGIDIHYLRTGGARPPVLLLHGLTDNGACWSLLARELAGDYDLIMPDARGHGRSSVPDRGYRTEDRAADALGLIDALGLDRPALIGHSMGGLTAATVAAMAPERICGAILEDPSLRPPEWWGEVAKSDWPAQHRAALAMGEAALIAQGRADNPRWAAEVFPTWARAKLETSPRAFDWFGQPPADPALLVPRIGVPTLLITGDPARGAIVSAAQAAELCAANPLLQVANIPGAGHCIRYEEPARFAAIARAFLSELARPEA